MAEKTELFSIATEDKLENTNIIIYSPQFPIPEFP